MVEAANLLCLRQVWRDVVFGPFAEEFVFRSCMAPLLLLEVRWPPSDHDEHGLNS